MIAWQEDVSNYSLDEVVKMSIQHMAWSKELRLSMSGLVNKRLAKDIGLEEYAAERKLQKEHLAECQRRAGILRQAIDTAEQGRQHTRAYWRPENHASGS